MCSVRLAAISMSGIASAALLGFVIGVALGALGGGGSILAVPALVYVVGERAQTAMTTSLVAVGATAFVGLAGHIRTGTVRVAPGLIFGIVGIGGSLLGSLLNRMVSSEVLLLAFSVLILVAAWRMHVRQAETSCHARQFNTVAIDGDRGRPASARRVRPARAASEGSGTVSGGERQRRAVLATGARVVIAGTIVGFLTGLFGVGGGFVIVPALVLALDFEIPAAVGTSLLVIVITSAEGVIFRLPGGEIDWRVAIPFTAAGIIGVGVGTLIASRVPAARLTRWFVWLLVAVACYTVVQSIRGM
ncbi:sulfite exporter TauE/SafE family protein [Mycobacterium botniense]|uniref:Probable membrane transporter protein n=1 Tax=Mycobacterium botniense TaxID=84962 RepID=A0A7I9XU95_9MYCO|nr:sulfite exporter TauE/SafE family protein [Mycobacterium botniense]GFG73505.1 UPF0721 transmembrane protein [Mycobacterium botniense]